MTRPPFSCRGFLWLLLPLVSATLSGSCGRAPQAPAEPPPPLVLITLEGLRADAVGAFHPNPTVASATPNLDRLAAEADWAGRGVASSGWAAPAGASVFTGLSPWKHGVWFAESALLRPELVTLPEALTKRGYRAAGHTGGRWLNPSRGYPQGFVSLRSLRRRASAALGALRNLAGRRFVWIHLPHPAPPWQRRDWLLTGDEPPDLPKLVRLHELGSHDDPAAGLSGEQRERYRALYRNNVAWADVQIGRFLAALRESGHWEECLLIVTSTHGLELGEEGRIGDGASLSRAVLEVPLIIKLPAGFSRPIAASAGSRVGTVRLFATLVDAAGGDVPPGVAPSLFDTRAPGGVLSELYEVAGGNLFSFVTDDEQLLWESRFAHPAASRARAGLGGAFRTTLPLSGRAATELPRWTLLRWTDDDAEVVDDPRETGRLAAELRRRWMRFLPEETTPARSRSEPGSGRKREAG